MRIIIISDFHYSEIAGGAESNDLCLENLLKTKHKVEFITTKAFNEVFHKTDADLYILSNFYFISQEAEFFLYNRNYVIIEHDYKFTRSRNPYMYPNFIVPHYEKVHLALYALARYVILQSRFQMEIFKANLDQTNLYCFSGNLWPEDELMLMAKQSLKPKIKKVAIIKSESAIKGTQTSVNHCLSLGKPYDLIAEPDHNKFLSLMGQYEALAFLPSSPETFSRVCLEARMMAMDVITNDLVGVSRESYFSNFPDDIIDEMRRKKQEIIKLITSCV